LRIAISGSIAFDYLMQFPGKFQDHFLPDKLHQISVSFLVDSLRQERGGCAANIAYTLALLGERPLLVGSAGKDFAEYQKALEAVGVDTSGVLVVENEYTSSFFANTDLNGNQICSFYTGAMRFAKDISLGNLPGNGIDFVVISPNDPSAMVQYAMDCQGLNIPYLFDPGQQIVRLDSQSLFQCAKGAKMLIVNEYERELFKRKTHLDDDGMRHLAEIRIVTLGEKGTMIDLGNKTLSIPIVPPKRVMDPTGVGDAFRAGLMKGMMNGLSWETSGRMGSLAATYVIETEGAQRHWYTFAEFADRYQAAFGESLEIAFIEK
jgi:adenosine kinase